MHSPQYRQAFTLMFVTAGCLFALSGCFGGLVLGYATLHDKDVSHKESLWGGYEPGATYEVLMDVFLEKKQGGTTKPVLTPPGEVYQVAGLYNAPDSVPAYNSNSDAWPEVVGIVEAGTRICTAEVRKRGALLWGSWVYVLAEILDGPNKGRIVDITDLSVFADEKHDDLILNKPDPRLLRKTD